jgi:ribosomal protein S1
VKGEVVRGRILKIENEFFTVKNTAGKEVRLHVDKNTHRGQVNLKDEEFKEGDRIEAYMSPKGHAITITLIRGQGNMPGDPEGGG